MQKVAIFKPHHKLNIIIYSLLLIGIIYLGYFGFWDNRMSYVFGGLFTFFLIKDILEQNKNYLLKIDSQKISYKDGLKVIRWDKINSFEPVLGFGTTPSKVIFNTKNGVQEFVLKNYAKQHLDKVMTELYKHQNKDVN